MEIIFIVIAVLAFLGIWFFFKKPNTEETESAAPYKLEAPEPKVVPEKTTPVEEKVEHRVNPVALALEVDPIILPAKTPRKPRAPKAEKPATGSSAESKKVTAPKKPRSKKT
jgi:cytoskeletal protein RodZ